MGLAKKAALVTGGAMDGGFLAAGLMLDKA